MARLSVVEYIEDWYNRQRRDSALGYISPAEFGAALAGYRVDVFIDTMTEAINGFSARTRWGFLSGLFGAVRGNTSLYFLGAYAFNDTGFNQAYQDPYPESINQVYHFWFYVACGHIIGSGGCGFGNSWHESLFNPAFEELLCRQGCSDQDWRLGRMGIAFGEGLKSGLNNIRFAGMWMRFFLNAPYMDCPIAMSPVINWRICQ